MFQAYTARATASQCRSVCTRLGLTAATALLLFAAAPAAAQQYGSVGTSVTVDYGVLDSLGNGGPNLPGMLSGGYPQQGEPYAYGSPYGAAPGAPYPPTGQLLAPPASAPRSTLTSQLPGQQAGTAPGAEAPIKLIPPSELKKKVAATPPPAPAPAPAPQPTTQAAVEPPPPPTPVEPAPAAAPAAEPSAEPSAPAVPMPEAPAAAEQQAAAEPPPPPAPPPVPAPAAAPAPAPEPVAAQPEPAPASEPDTTPAPEPETAAAEPAPAEPAAEAPAQAEAQPPAEEATQEAALPPQEKVEGQISVIFAEGVSELTDEARTALDGVAEKLRADDGLRVQLLAYAQAIDDNTSRARRMSLSRALAVRSYLIEKGVRSTRMDVRALGSNVEGEPADRVDIIPQAQ